MPFPLYKDTLLFETHDLRGNRQALAGWLYGMGVDPGVVNGGKPIQLRRDRWGKTYVRYWVFTLDEYGQRYWRRSDDGAATEARDILFPDHTCFSPGTLCG